MYKRILALIFGAALLAGVAATPALAAHDNAAGNVPAAADAADSTAGEPWVELANDPPTDDADSTH